MYRCLELARRGAGHVAPNPLVGAVLVYQDRIIGEGWHQEYGKAHAEVNCIDSVKEEDKELISQSTLYVSLEPCAHFGKTPPCADLIIKNRIPGVVIGAADPFKEVNGKGIEKLRVAGVKVAIAEKAIQTECARLNKRFLTFHNEQRPYVVLKWAQTSNGKMASAAAERLFISNEFTNRLVHQWRSEEAAILVGTNTALLDDPELTNRLWDGPSPIRLVIDMNLRLPQQLKIFKGKEPTIVFNDGRHTVPDGMKAARLKQEGGTWYHSVEPGVFPLKNILASLYKLDIQSVLVEGGAQLLQTFLEDGAWDETRVITNETLLIKEGLEAPRLLNARLATTEKILSDSIETYYPVREEI